MNWTQFLSGLTAIYLIYYVPNLLFDFLKSGVTTTDQDSLPELMLDEEEGVTDASKDPDDASQPRTKQVLSSGEIKSTGGVSMKEMFALAKADAIKFTGAVPY